MKINKKDIQIGMIFSSKENFISAFEYRESGSYSFTDILNVDLTNENVIITSLVYRTKGNGDIIRFKKLNSPIEFASFWSSFKESTTYVPSDDIVLNSTKSAPKAKKTQWSDMQAARLGAPGYYIEYYGKPSEYPTEYGVIYIGAAKCKYIHYSAPPSRQDWSTLLWSCAPTKRKINLAITDIENVIYRYHYFKTHEELLQFKSINFKPGALIPVIE